MGWIQLHDAVRDLRPRLSLLVVPAVLAAGVSGCQGAGHPSAGRTPPTTTASPTAAVGDSADPLVDPAWLADPVPVATTTSRGPALLPELSDVPYAVGRSIRFEGVTITLPKGIRVEELEPAGSGYLAAVCESPGPQCHTDYGDRTGRLVALAGSSTSFAANASGTLVGTVAGKAQDRMELYELPSGRRVAESPAIPPAAATDAQPQPRGFDGDDIVYDADHEGQYRWTPGTSTVVEDPAYDPNAQETLSWVGHLLDVEVPSWASPYGPLVAVGDQAQGWELGVLRTPDLSTVMSKRAICRRCTIDQAYWLDADTLVLLTTPDQRHHLQIVRFDLRTRRWSTSRTVDAPVFIAQNRRPAF